MEYLQCHEMEMLLGLGWQEVELYIGVKLHKIAIYNLMYSKNFTVMIIWKMKNFFITYKLFYSDLLLYHVFQLSVRKFLLI